MSKDREIGYTFWGSKAMADIQTLSQAEKGYYLDLMVLSANKQVFTEDDVRKILGRRFPRHWDALKRVLVECTGGYCIGWVHDSIERKIQYNLSRNHQSVKNKIDELE